MKLKPLVDDELRPKGQRWAWPIRSIGRLMIVVAVCGAALSFMAGVGKQRHRRIVSSMTLTVGRPGQAPQIDGLELQPRDPLVVVAAAEIDAKMVVPAPAGIDEAMVFNPYTGERLSAQRDVAPGSLLMPFPGTPPGQVPEYYFAPQPLPQLPAPARPR